MRSVLLSCALMLSCVGCSVSYPGSVEVKSCYPDVIEIETWEGAGRLAIPRGFIPSGGCGIDDMGKTIVNDRQKTFPEMVTVVWHVDPGTPSKDGGEERKSFRREINLDQIVPKGANGTTTFSIDKDGKWSVTFVPKRG